MFVPFLSDPNSGQLRVYRRKGGGGGSSKSSSSSSGKSSSSSSGKSSSGSSSSSSSSKGSAGSSGGQAGKSSSSSSSSVTPSKSKYKSITSGWSSSSSSKTNRYRGSTTYGNPIVPPPLIIPAGQMFAGRIAGGATRSQIFGSRTYGSGYPGVSGRGTAGRGFPFIFWPLAWPLAVGGGVASAAYLHNNFEYGDPTNSSRPGGPMAYATFPSSSSNPPTVIFRILSDNSTVLSLIDDLSTNCTSYLPNSSPAPNSLSTLSTGASPFISPYTFSNTTGPANPQPEQVIQYYRASTIALSLDSYNNTATFSTADGTPDSALPVLGAKDAAFMDCLNQTIALAAPLINGSGMLRTPSARSMSLLWLVWWILAFF